MEGNMFDQISQFEAGELDRDEVIELMQALLDTRVIYSLQGSYQRLAQRLIDENEIVWR
jgi:hypothetical protein